MIAPMPHPACLAALPDAEAVLPCAMPGLRIGKVVVAGFAGRPLPHDLVTRMVAARLADAGLPVPDAR